MSSSSTGNGGTQQQQQPQQQQQQQQQPQQQQQRAMSPTQAGYGSLSSESSAAQRAPDSTRVGDSDGAPQPRAAPTDALIPRRMLVMFMLRLNIFERTHFLLFTFVALMALAMCITPLCVYVLISDARAQQWFVAHVNALQSVEVYVLALFLAAFVPGLATLISVLLRVDTVYVVVLGLFAGALDLAFNTCRNVALFMALIKPTAGGYMPVPPEEVQQLRGQIGDGPDSFTVIVIVLGATYLFFYALQHLLHSVYYKRIRTALRTGENLEQYVDSSGEVLV